MRLLLKEEAQLRVVFVKNIHDLLVWCPGGLQEWGDSIPIHDVRVSPFREEEFDDADVAGANRAVQGRLAVVALGYHVDERGVVVDDVADLAEASGATKAGEQFHCLALVFIHEQAQRLLCLRHYAGRAAVQCHEFLEFIQLAVISVLRDCGVNGRDACDALFQRFRPEGSFWSGHHVQRQRHAIKCGNCIRQPGFDTGFVFTRSRPAETAEIDRFAAAHFIHARPRKANACTLPAGAGVPGRPKPVAVT
mmetsp:Transcript_70241/g.222704  ORF Transcript_70241/g.222704 Transcript_70241/m.222704 type:complete len:250 (+) Transcript_70241:921-1670(+)